MQWIALRWLPEDAAAPAANAPTPEALGWWALQFTPRAAWVDEALLLEVSACERLWGGRRPLMRLLAESNPAPTALQQSLGDTSLVALARLRLMARGLPRPADLPGGLPLDTLSAAREHLDLLARMGCRTWGDVAALPRGGLIRRFGHALREALDQAWGLQPERHAWLTLPESFDQKLELPALAHGAPELMWSANRLLAALQIWLRARQRGVLAFELEWTLDLRRFEGVDLPPHQQVVVRTAEPTQDMAHLRRLLGERLALSRLAAPASWLRLRSIETQPWAGASISFLPEDNRKGDRLHQLVERLSARLGAAQVLVPMPRADHRPECMQQWDAAQDRTAQKRSASASASPSTSAMSAAGASIYPPWLLRQPLRLDMLGEHPCYCGPLRRLIGPQRLEVGWWGGENSAAGRPTVRDYYIAESEGAGLVWIYCERPLAAELAQAEATAAPPRPRWFLQGLYA